LLRLLCATRVSLNRTLDRSNARMSAIKEAHNLLKQWRHRLDISRAGEKPVAPPENNPLLLLYRRLPYSTATASWFSWSTARSGRKFPPSCKSPACCRVREGIELCLVIPQSPFAPCNLDGQKRGLTSCDSDVVILTGKHPSRPELSLLDR